MTLSPDTSRTYTSAEFMLSSPGIFFRFKLRHTPAEPMFALVRAGSAALAALSAGDVLPMTYYFPDKAIPAEKRETRIKYIRDGNAHGFKDHVMIALDIDRPGADSLKGPHNPPMDINEEKEKR